MGIIADSCHRLIPTAAEKQVRPERVRRPVDRYVPASAPLKASSKADPEATESDEPLPNDPTARTRIKKRARDRTMTSVPRHATAAAGASAHQ